MAGYCKSCKHPAHPTVDCPQCGCVRYKDRAKAREERSRLWIANVEFLTTKKGWVKAPEVRVRALGATGAAMKAVREAKQLALTSRMRVAQVKITLTPVARSKQRVE